MIANFFDNIYNVFIALICAPFIFFAFAFLYDRAKAYGKHWFAKHMRIYHANQIYHIQREEENRPHSASFWKARHEFLLKNIK